MIIKHTPTLICAFWELARCGLWEETPDPDLFHRLKRNDWQELFALIEKQTMTGTCFSAMQKLPLSCRPDRSLYLEWYTKVLQIIHHHHLLLRTYDELNELFSSQGITPIMMKGLGIATCYPDPSLRMTGDIDLFIAQNFQQTISLIEDQQIEIQHLKEHDKFEYNAVSIELHPDVIHLPTRMNASNSWNNVNAIVVYDNNHTLHIPDEDTHALLLLTHPFKHLFAWGIGIRHLCDWAMFLHKNHDAIHQQQVMAYLQKVKLTGFASAFTALAVDRLGLNPEIAKPWIICRQKKEEQNLEQDMLTTGDIGNKVREYSRELNKSGLSMDNFRKRFSFSYWELSRIVRLYALAPCYAKRKLRRKIVEILHLKRRSTGGH